MGLSHGRVHVRPCASRREPLPRIPLQKGAHPRQVCGPLVFDRPFQYFSLSLPPFFAVFRRFPALDAGLDRPVCILMSFFAPKRPNLAESLENAIREGSKNNSGKKYFLSCPNWVADTCAPLNLPVRHSGRSRPADLALSGAEGASLGPASVAGRISPLRLRSGQATTPRRGAGLRSK